MSNHLWVKIIRKEAKDFPQKCWETRGNVITKPWSHPII